MRKEADFQLDTERSNPATMVPFYNDSAGYLLFPTVMERVPRRRETLLALEQTNYCQALREDFGDLTAGRGIFPEAGAHRVVDQREVEIADGSVELEMPSVRDLVAATGDQSDMSVRLVRTGLGVFVHEHQ